MEWMELLKTLGILLGLFLICVAVYIGITALQMYISDRDFNSERRRKKKDKSIRDMYGLHTKRTKKE